MFKEGFYSLKEELISNIIEFELLKRKSNFYKQTYLLELSNEIRSNFNFSIENEIMLEAIKKLSEGINKEEVLANVENRKKELLARNINFDKNLEEAYELSKRCEKYSVDEILKLDNDFAIYCRNYHPILQSNPSDSLKTAYNILAKVYRDGNIEAYYKIYNELANTFSNIEINESEYDGYAFFYKQSITNIVSLINTMKNSFPLNLEEKFFSEEGITTLIAEEREKVYNLRELNKVIKSDYKLNFSKDL